MRPGELRSASSSTGSGQVDQEGHHDQRGDAEEGGDAERHVEAVHQVGRDAGTGLQLRVTRRRAQDGDQDGQSEGGPDLLGDVDQTGRGPGVSGLDAGEPGRGQGHERGPRAQAEQDEADEDLRVRRPGVQLARQEQGDDGEADAASSSAPWAGPG